MAKFNNYLCYYLNGMELSDMFLGGIGFKNFLDTHQEWHALVEGFGDGFCPWGSAYEPSSKLAEDIRNEHHYYTAGSAIGFIALIFAIAGAVRLVIGAFL